MTYCQESKKPPVRHIIVLFRTLVDRPQFYWQVIPAGDNRFNGLSIHMNIADCSAIAPVAFNVLVGHSFLIDDDSMFQHQNSIAPAFE